MDQTQLTGKLHTLTGSLQPAGKATAANLQRARGAPAAAAAGAATDVRPAEVASAAEPLSALRFAQLDPAQQQQFSGSQAGPAPGFISSLPVTVAFDASAPAWARGMVVETPGPFQDTGGAGLYLIHIPTLLTQEVTLMYGSQVFAVVTIVGAPVAGKSSYNLAQGSVWIDAQMTVRAFRRRAQQAQRTHRHIGPHRAAAADVGAAAELLHYLTVDRRQRRDRAHLRNSVQRWRAAPSKDTLG